MAISESLIDNGVSATTVAAGATSDVIIEGGSPGQVFLEAQAPGSAVWVTVTQQTGSFAVATPDAAILYRFRGQALTNSTAVYFGA